MIIKKLVLENFGSYFKRTTIEFPESGLFLISGPTGAGKTTILDAISFAIFGKIPRYGGAETYKPIISQGPIKKPEAYVELQFKLYKSTEETYTIIRKVKTKNNKTGYEGEVRLIKGNQNIANSNKDYEKQMEKILGIKLDEAYKAFTKSIFLPQNAFDGFISENSKERQKLIFNLLNLNIYNELKEKINQEYNKIKSKKDTINNQLELLKKELENYIKQKEDKIRNIKTFDNLQISQNEEIKQKIQQRIEQIKKAKESIIQKTSLLGILEVSLDTLIKDLSDYYKNLENLIQSLEELNYIDLDKESIKLAQEIINDTNFKLILDKASNLEKEIKEIKKSKNFENYYQKFDIYYTLQKNIESNECYRNLYEKIIDIIDTQKNYKKLKDEIDKLQESISYKEQEIEKIEKEIFDHQKEKELKEKEIQQINDLIKKNEKELEQIKKEIEQKEKKLDIKEKVLAIQKVIIEKKLDECIVCYHTLEDENKSNIKKSLQTGKTKILSDIQEYEINKKLKEEEIKNNNKELELKEKEYKNICLKLDSLIQKKENLIEEKSEKETKIKNLTLELEKYNPDSYKDTIIFLKNLYYEIFQTQPQEGFLNELKDILSSKQELEKTLLLINDYLKYYSNYYLKYRSKLQNLNSLESINKYFDNKLTIILLEKLNKILFSNDYLKIRNTIFSDKFFELHKQLKQSKEKLKEIIENINNQQEKFNQVNKEIIQLKTIIKNIDNIQINKLEEVKEIKEKLEKLKKLKAEFEENEFIKNTSFNTLQYSDSINTTIQKIIKTLVELKNYSKDYKSHLEEEKKQLEEEEEILNDIKNLEDKIQEMQDKNQSLQQELESISKELEIISILKDDFETRKGNKTDFLAFVFDTLFNLIKQKANKILYEITEGRYEIEFLANKEEIEVVDNWYSLRNAKSLSGGEELRRNVKSLSGGEKFLLSLSIAMAISEFMSISKFKTKSLFIDEGFGTLDQNTLNDIMDYLENYFNNNSNSVLGIITHVEEIKDRFNYVINVQKSKDGSIVNIINNL